MLLEAPANPISFLQTKFTKQSRTRLRRHEAVDTYSSESMIQRHSGVLGLCAFIDAYPYDVPDFVPDVFSVLGDHLNDPPPISVSITFRIEKTQLIH
jgi:proteasome activator subunit 4